MTTNLTLNNIQQLLGGEADSLLLHTCNTIAKEKLHLPGKDYIDRVLLISDRKPAVLGNMQRLFNSGRLGGTGYLSIFPVDQGIEHSAGASFAQNPDMFDPETIVQFALEAGCNGVVSTLGGLGIVARKYAHKIPLIAKINHNELMSYPNIHDQTIFGSAQKAFDMGCIGIGATIYWGSPESRRQLQEVAVAFEQAHELGMFTILWCYLRNSHFKTKTQDQHMSADLTGQANHLGVTLHADIIKQKLPETNGGYLDAELKGYGKTHPLVYKSLTADHPIDLTRYQLLNCYMGRIGLINSGGASTGENDLADAVRTAVINKRAGGMGLIVGRKAFQRPFAEGVKLLHAVQDIYLNDEITIA